MKDKKEIRSFLPKWAKALICLAIFALAVCVWVWLATWVSRPIKLIAGVVLLAAVMLICKGMGAEVSIGVVRRPPKWLFPQNSSDLGQQFNERNKKQ